jgi:hypothetical protein
VFSGDLKKATDTFCHAYLKFFCNWFSLDHDLVYSNFMVEGVPTKRGAFMGLPLSWTILDLTHYLICRVVDPSMRFRIKGDDILAYWSVEQIKRWKFFCRMVGFVVNDKKSFNSRDAGTFCEAHYILREDGLHIQPTLSVKTFVTTGNVDRFQVISSISDQAYKRGVSPKRTNLLLGMYFPRELRFAREKKLPLYLPSSMGGLGMIPDDPSRKMTLKESMWYWGCLEKDLPTLHVPSGLSVDGPFIRKVRQQMDKCVYRSSLRKADECPHFEAIIGANLERATVNDVDRREKRIPLTIEKMRRLKIFRRRVVLVQSPNETLWKVSRSTKMGYTRTSVDKAFPHRCEGVPCPKVNG